MTTNLLGRHDHERPLIGRRTEIEIISRTLHEVQAGAGRGLLIEGEAGIGKSRLVQEIQRLAREVGLSYLVGTTDSIEQLAPYRAWRDIIRGLFGLDGAMNPTQHRERVVEQVRTLNPDYVDRAPLLNDILRLNLPESRLTSSFDPELRQRSLAALVGELLLQQTMDRAIVLVIEDVHWAESLSWDLVLSVIRMLVHQPVCFVLTHRPFSASVPPQYSALAPMPSATQLILKPLVEADVASVAAARLGVSVSALPKAVVKLLDERVRGNPFYAMELVGALCDQHLLVVEEEMCVVTVDEDKLRRSLPSTLEGVVLSRLSYLPPDEQLTVGTAAVIGRSFSLQALRDVRPGQLDEARLRAHLSDTSQRHLTLQEDEDGKPVYAFAHVVTQEVAYDTLSIGQVSDLHQSIATWYEREYEDNLSLHYPVLVVHWSRAGNAKKEAHFCQLAGQQAASQYANAEAERYLSRALELMEKMCENTIFEKRFEVLQQRVQVFAILGRVDEERGDLDMLLAMAGQSQDGFKQGEVLVDWADLHNRCGQFEEALKCGEEALAVLRDAGSSEGEARALSQLAKTLEGRGDFPEAHNQVDSALSIFRDAGIVDGQAASLKSLGIISTRLGELPQAMEHFEAARALYRQIGDRKGVASISGNLGSLSFYLEHFEDAIQYTQDAQDIFRVIGDKRGQAKCLANLGVLHLALGNPEHAISNQEEALTVYREMHDSSGEAESLGNLAVAYESIGADGHPELATEVIGSRPEFDEAHRLNMECLSRFQRSGNRQGEAVTYFNLGSTSLCCGSLDQASDFLRKALRLAEEIGVSRIAARSHSAIARLDLHLEEPSKAMEHSNEAVELVTEQNIPIVEEVRFTHSVVLQALGQVEQAAASLQIAANTVLAKADTIQADDIRARFLASCKPIIDAWRTLQAG